jgi:hypothetical protein
MTVVELQEAHECIAASYDARRVVDNSGDRLAPLSFERARQLVRSVLTDGDHDEA